MAIALILVAMTFTMLFLAVAGPFQESMSEEVEAIVHGAPGEAPSGFRHFLRSLWYGVRQALVLLPVNLLALALGFVPVVGPAIALAWSALMLGYTFFEIPANRRILRFSVKRRLASAHPASILGLGLPIALLSLMPVVFVATLPVFVVAGTLLYLDIAGRDGAPLGGVS
jgi:uncharacterized protein involved in cysteine biosynthesis